MIPLEVNPFHELFFTDSAPAEEFVRYFSPYLVPNLPELFQKGNVVLKGTNGCGKTMLLTLFRPEIQVAYAKRQEELKKIIPNPEFPVPPGLRAFIGAGVNLGKSGLLDCIQLLPSEPTEDDFQNFTALFCDFLNYWLLRDLIQSLQYVANNREVFGELVNRSNFDRFANLLRKQDCWFGYLAGCDSLKAIGERVDLRVVNYRRWNARNISKLDETMLRSKTAIGEPLSRTVDCLKEAKVIASEVPVFLRIDQMEQLWHQTGKQAILSSYFRRAINKVIGSRDTRVSFRVGTRRYAWSEDLTMPGGRQIEEYRDFVVVDLDRRLRRREDQSNWLFEDFAADVFRLRVSSASAKDSAESLDVHSFDLNSFFGPSPTPHQLVERLIVSPPEDPRKLLRLDEDWSKPWRDYVIGIYNKEIERKKPKCSENYPKNPLDALLMTAWALQTGGKKGGPQRRSGPPPQNFPPWTVWWEKERLMLAVMQLVVRHQQTLFWWGTKRALALSASNITLFLSICREVWDQWRRRSRAELEKEAVLRRSANAMVSWKTQAVAIDNVSKSWHRNFARQPGRPGGDVRMRFIDEVGNWLRRGMVSDFPMKYPGANGFSLTQSELKSNKQLAALIEEAVGWGDLYEVDHTTKVAEEKHRDPRKKYYLNPILSPHFQIPDAHTKEPVYAPVETIIKLAIQGRALTDNQRDLPFDPEPLK